MKLSAMLPAVVVLTAGLFAQAPAKTAQELSALGPQVGQRVPEFRLPDQNGKMQTVKSTLRANGAMLVFFRSADW